MPQGACVSLVVDFVEFDLNSGEESLNASIQLLIQLCGTAVSEAQRTRGEGRAGDQLAATLWFQLLARGGSGQAKWFGTLLGAMG